MNVTRRSFIGALGAAAVAGASLGAAPGIFGQVKGSAAAFGGPLDAVADRLSFMTSKDFEAFLNTPFTVGEGGSVLVLTGVRDLVNPANMERGFTGESFSLLFERQAGKKLTQDTYQFRHEALGEFTLLLVPVGIRGKNYEVIVNRISR